MEIIKVDNNQEKIILIDSSTTIDEIIPHIQNNNSKIISFDYESHKELVSRNIVHEISDDFLKKEEMQEIQKKIFYFNKWWNQPSIFEYLDHNGINIGKLFHDEFYSYVIQFLKKLYEIKQIVTLFPNVPFITSEILYDIVTIFSKQVNKLTQTNKKSFSFVHDKIRIDLKIGNHDYIFFISKSFYKKIKITSEKFVHFLFRPTNYNNKNRKSVLLVEFDPVKFSTFFLMAKKYPINFFFYGRRRPAIWNLESFSIMQKSGCKIITSYSLDDQKCKESMQNSINQIRQKIPLLWKNHDLQKFFSINGFSFWHIIKPILIELIENRLENTIQEIEFGKRVFEKFHFDSVLVLSEIGFNEQIVIKQAKKVVTPIIQFQEGLYYNTPEAYEHNQLVTAYPVDTDKFIAWGKITEDDTIRNGNVPPEKIQALGSVRYDDIMNYKEKINKDFVLLATKAPEREDINGLNVSNIEKYIEGVEKICKTVIKQKKKLIVKLHPSPDELDITDIIKKIHPQIKVVKTGKIIPLIQLCDLVIVVSHTTVILEAQILHKPVIAIPLVDYNWGNPEPFKSKLCLMSSLTNLEKDLQQIYNNKKFKQSIIQNGNEFIKNYFSNLGVASKKVVEYIISI